MMNTMKGLKMSAYNLLKSTMNQENGNFSPFVRKKISFIVREVNYKECLHLLFCALTVF